GDGWQDHHARDLLFRYFLMRRPPPRPTLFPYTTLFRSRPGEGERTARCSKNPIETEQPLAPTSRRPERRCECEPRCVREAGQRGDRKSTRLNSSHVKISYAVFCLKKKNQRRPIRWPAYT